MKYIIFLLLIVFGVFACENSSSSKLKPKEIIIGIQPYGDVGQEEIDLIEEAILKEYGFQVVKLEPRKMDKEAYTTVRFPRYRADSMIRIQRKRIPQNVTHVLGITDKDISITKKNKDGTIKKPERRYRDFGIFGLGFRPGNSAIVSIYRLKAIKSLFKDRFQKIVLHEVGHNLGLAHCKDKMCLMTSAAESIKTIDKAKGTLCAVCKDKIKKYVK